VARIVELIALVLMRKGMDAALAWLLADEVGREIAANSGAGSQPDPLASCRMRGRADLEDDCYAWDLPDNLRRI
jgi:hypothetical protein